MRYVARISSEAHKKVMQSIHPGLHEYHAEAEFLAYTYYVGGCRHVSYTCICGVGNNSSILHYGHAGAPNDYEIKDGDMWYVIQFICIKSLGDFLRAFSKF